MLQVVAGTPVIVSTSPAFTDQASNPSAPYDPTSVQLAVRIAGQATQTFTYTNPGGDPTNTISKVSTGSYQATFDTSPGGFAANPNGVWSVRWKGTGGLDANMYPVQFEVTPDQL